MGWLYGSSQIGFEEVEGRGARTSLGWNVREIFQFNIKKVHEVLLKKN
jgi:hypothetical protein